MGTRPPAAIVARAYLATGPLVAVALVFTDDPRALAGAEDSLCAVAVGMLAVVAAETWIAAVLGTGDTTVGLGIELLVSGLVIGCAATTALVLTLSLPLVWVSLALASGVGLVASCSRSGRGGEGGLRCEQGRMIAVGRGVSLKTGSSAAE